MPKVVIRSLGIVLAAFMAFVGSQSLPANAALGSGVTTQVALVPTAGLALSDDNDDPMARCNAPADSSTPGEDGYTAPAPMKLDASGTDQDGICIPADVDFNHPVYGWGSYYIGDKMLMAGFNPAKGASSITVGSSYNSGSWEFNFSTQQTGTEAANIYRLRVAKKCKKSYFSDRYRRAWAYVTNVADDTARSFSVYPRVEYVKAGGSSIADTDSAHNVPDGSTATMRIREYVSSGILGLRPGKYKVTFWLSDSDHADVHEDYVGKRKKLFVPRCGGNRR